MTLLAEITDTQRKTWMARYVDELWDGMEGFAAVEMGFGGRLGPTERYEFNAYQAKRFSWPAERLRLLKTAWAVSPEADVYVCPMLRSRPDRKVGGGAGGRHLWADLDDWSHEVENHVEKLMRPGSFLIRSGRGRHLYLALEHVMDCGEVALLNHRLAATLGGDAKWQENSVLRLPGTMYHKPRTVGRESTVVTWETT